MTDTPDTPSPTASAAPRVTPNDIIRFILEVVAVISLAIWGLTMWPMPWPGVAFAIGAPLIAILLWALFLSPKAVFQVDAFGRALFEIIVMGSVALAWWSMGLPIVAGAFALLATVSGVINGRSRL
ncbi:MULTISPECIES: YrdB family protein [Microterricola]|uniref:4-amino-4-deoxy-L-arabinose transferase n=2 Tax=Microterricola TaxID=518733 RepID=A0A1H1QJ21_9MICO|nr:MULTISPECIES: YrdB family protein [Microterricola]PPL15993.1 4-amino-4-deoxy-L-arabinose transferase [Microterricola pindariensis]SDS23313.1 Protein of unknown function [Microterricola viridarii]